MSVRIEVSCEPTCGRCGYYLAKVGESSDAIECSDRAACDERYKRTTRVDELLRDYRRRHGLPEPIQGNN